MAKTKDTPLKDRNEKVKNPRTKEYSKDNASRAPLIEKAKKNKKK